jgi:hypothetical protein
MNTKLKKLLIILVIIIIIALVGLLVYNFFIKKPEAEEFPPGRFPPGEEGEVIPPGEEPEEEKELVPEPVLKIKAISKEAVLAPTLTADEKGVIYYLRSGGIIWQSNFDGSNLSQVSDAILENLVKIIWASDKDKVISIFQDSLENISKYFYTFETDKALPLNKYINYIAWSADNSKIAYQYQNEFTDENNISTSNPDGSNYSNIIETRMKDLIIEWPKGIEIFIREKPSGLVQSSLYSLNPYTKDLTKIISDIYGFSIKWSLHGSKLLYSKTSPSGQNITIFAADRTGSNQKSINISTLVEKCTWSQDPRLIFCAIPKNIEDAGMLPDDFYKGTFLADDEFWKINIETGEKTKALEDNQILETYDATDLFLSPQEDYLFFVNKVNGLLYSIELD